MISRFFKLGLAIGLAGLFAPRLLARPMRSWMPDELAEKAAVICNAVPSSIRQTGEKQVSDSTHFQAAVARLKVIGVTKGDLRVGEEIEVHFSALDLSAYPRGIVSPPFRMGFETGKRCRVYLNPAVGHPWYVGALDGEYDDGCAVHRLDPKEADQGAPLFKPEAIKLASAYYRKVAPSAKIDPKWIEARYDIWRGDQWVVEFWSKPPLSYPSFTSDAEIFVNEARNVDEKQSWIADGFPFSEKELTPRRIGASLRITQERTHGNLDLLWGKLTGLDADEIRGRFYCSSERDSSVAAIPRKFIRGIQVLKKSPSF